MHSAHLNNKINIMEKDLGNFPLCGGCSRKERREGLKDVLVLWLTFLLIVMTLE